MSEAQDKASKTEEPTDKKRREAHERGQFAKAEELNTVAVLIAAVVVFAFWGPEMVSRFVAFSVHVLSNLWQFNVQVDTANNWVRDAINITLSLLTPLFVGVSIAAIIAGGLQSGFKFTPKTIKPDINKINPVSGLKRIFSLKSIMAALMDLLKILGVAVVVWSAVEGVMRDPVFFTPVPRAYVVEFIANNAFIMFIRVIVLLAIIALLHYFYQRWQTHEDLKMTRQEVKEERKSQEGSPEMRLAQRRMALQMMRQEMAQGVPTADVVVTNPTHFAVALRYEQGRDSAPVVVAKGENLFAQKIKEIAREHDVPMVENVPLARTLFKFGVVGSAIPENLYTVVADVLATVYRTHKYYFHRLRARRALLG